MSTTLIQLLTERETAIRQTVTIFADKFKIDPDEAQQLLDWMLVGQTDSSTGDQDDAPELSGFWRGDEWINE